jgi:hypothetical protein
MLVNAVALVMLVVLLGAYASLYYFWKSPAGRTLVGGLVAALLVMSGGAFEQFGWIGPHDWLVGIGYTMVIVVLAFATRHVLGLRHKSTEHDIPRRPPAETPHG